MVMDENNLFEMDVPVDGIENGAPLINLDVTPEEIENLIEKTKIVPLPDDDPLVDNPPVDNPPIYGSKVCPTSHGCTGTSYCDNSYGDYPY